MRVLELTTNRNLILTVMQRMDFEGISPAFAPNCRSEQ